MKNLIRKFFYLVLLVPFVGFAQDPGTLVIPEEAPSLIEVSGADGEFKMWANIFRVFERTEDKNFIEKTYAIPAEIAGDIKTQVIENPGESLVATLLTLVGIDQLANGGKLTQEVINLVRDKSDDGPPGYDEQFGDRDFATASSTHCTAAALHSSDISLHRSGDNGSCLIDIVQKELEE